MVKREKVLWDPKIEHDLETQSYKAKITQTMRSHLTFSYACRLNCSMVVEHIHRRQVATYFAGNPKIPNGSISETSTLSGVLEPA
jgi:hypothetical protein